jgi:hypothetical protein
MPKKISRRTILRGALAGLSAAVSLPLLEAMLDDNGEALADGGAIPCNFLVWFFGNGNIPQRWNPGAQGQGNAWQLSQQLAPLANVKDYCSVLSGFQNRCSQQITHHEGMTLFNGYTFVENSGLYSKAGGPTIDQRIAEAIGGVTTIDSVQLGVSKRLSVMDSGTTMHNLSHKSTNQPLPPEFNPKKVWGEMFGSFVPPNDPSGPLRLNVLDAVRETAHSLHKRLGTMDQQRVEAHLEGIDALQKKIEALPPSCDKPPEPTQSNEDSGGVEPIGAVSDVMSDLLAYAFSCDITRVGSMLFSGGAAETVFSEIGQNYVHHENTHNPGSALEEVHQVVLYAMERFAYLLERFASTPGAAGGNLLDNTIVLCGSDCSEGWTHSIYDQPIIVAGGGGGKLKHPSIHYRSSNGENPSDILLSLLRIFDPSAASVGGGAPMSTTPFAPILT